MNRSGVADAIATFVREHPGAPKHELEAAVPGSTRNGTLIAVLMRLGHLADSPRPAPKGYRWVLVSESENGLVKKFDREVSP